MYTLDEINVILSDLDACNSGSCRGCSRSVYWNAGSIADCANLQADAASVIRWLMSEKEVEADA